MKSKIITIILSILMIFGYVPVSAITQDREFTSLDFDSNEEQFVALDNNLDYIPNTMEAWVKLDNNPNKRQIIFGNYRDTTHPGFSIEITADNQLRYFEQIVVDGKKIECDIRTTDFSCDNQWVHIAVVRDTVNKNVSLIVNGTVYATKTTDVIKEKSILSDAHFVGTDYRKIYFFDGEIHSISLWNQTKTSEEIVLDMNTEINGTEEGLFHAWNFDQISINKDGKVYDLVEENKINATVSGYEILAVDIQKLKEAIKKYEQLIEKSDVSQGKKDAFTAVIEEVNSKLETVTSLQEVDELNEKLQVAYSDFGKPEDGKLEFVVVTDTHVQSNASSESARIYDDGLNDIVTTMPNAKAVVNCGDFSSDGADSEFERYYSIIDKYDENLKFINALGNHDVRWTSDGWEGVYDRYMSYNQKYMGDTDKVYYDIWIGEGEDKYHFVVLNTEWDIKDSSYISNEQIEWLDKTMAEGAKDDKPIFVVLHEPLRNTIANTDSYNGESDFPLDAGPQDYAIKEVLRKYPQSIILTGHVHPAVGANEIVKTDYGTLVNIPSYLRAGSIGYYVSVYDGKVQLSMHDFEHDRWLPEYHYTIDLTDEVPAGKVLDVTFDDETANDISGNNNNGKIVGNVEFVEGVKGKAIHIVNNETENEAKQYVDFGQLEDLQFGKDDFTIMFYYKGTKEMDMEGAIISNKNWDTGANPGFAIGTFTDPRPGIGSNFAVEESTRKDTNRYSNAIDGDWHHVAATFDRDKEMTLYIDGKKMESTDISADFGKTIDVEDLNLILGADGNKQYPINDGYIDELKIYRKVIEAYEMESVVAPYKVETDENKATVTWQALDDKFVPAYILLNGEKLTISGDATSYEITGLTPDTEYSIEIITRDKVYTRNLVFGHELKFKTEGTVNKELLEEKIKEVGTLSKKDYTQESWNEVEKALNKAKEVLADTDATQVEVDNALIKLETAVNNLVAVKPVQTDKTALKIAIDLANAITDEDLANVVQAVVDEFKAARDEANSAYNNSSATQEEINNAFDRLASVMQKLEFFKGDKTALKAFIDQVSELDSSKYSTDTWAAFEKELNEANAVCEDLNAMQPEVNSTYKELVTAFLNLRLIPDKSLLEELINQANGLNSANYTKASYGAMKTALEEAKVVFDNLNATQEEVDNAKATLEKAINGLETNTLAPVEDAVKTPVNNSDTTTSVKTGDYNLTGVYVSTALLSIAGCVILKRKKN
ncbi:LamG-like jellyroll fold domain-containing protein [Thomasclavelia spiroformis]|uniref:LamG-like jellyroll fold domain-containing protein n=1 Tax=Thomasclavelia spiroformis TaxID=29348 RepID=UPI00241FF659|nr:LamG-like jellyroll fold domain-containing protein [Thomasclavelia spiroformis]MBS6115648.1 FIVAR domain-containing protein [Thomasclavelia spiroformis]